MELKKMNVNINFKIIFTYSFSVISNLNVYPWKQSEGEPGFQGSLEWEKGVGPGHKGTRWSFILYLWAVTMSWVWGLALRTQHWIKPKENSSDRLPVNMVIKVSSARKKGEWCSDYGADTSCSGVWERRWRLCWHLKGRGREKQPGQRKSMEGVWQARGTKGRSARGRGWALWAQRGVVG